MADVELIKQRVAALSIEPGDVEAMRAFNEIKRFVDDVDFSTASIEKVVELCDLLIETLDRVFGDGTAAAVFEGSRVTVTGLQAAFEEAARVVRASNETLERTVSDLTETVPED